MGKPKAKLTIEQATKELYLQFCELTSLRGLMLPFEELPNIVKDAWTHVILAAREIDIVE